MILSSSDEHGTHPGVHPRKRRFVVRLSPAVELEAAAFSWGLASWILIRGFAFTTHAWMLDIASEAAWIVLFTMLGLCLSAAAWLRTGHLRAALLWAAEERLPAGRLRSALLWVADWLATGQLRAALLCVALAFFAALSVAASRHGTAMGLACAFTAHTMFLVALIRRSR